MALILDAGPLYALLDRSDRDHDACRELIEATHEPLVVPEPILAEVDYLVRSRMHGGVMLDVLDDITSGAYRIESLKEGDYRRIRELYSTYADMNIGFVDAAVLAITERLNEPKLATLDHRHFAAMRPRHVDALTLLP